MTNTTSTTEAAETAPKDTLLGQLLASIAGTWPAVTYHPEDPDRAFIESLAPTIGLTAVPDPTIGYRQVRGCPMPILAGSDEAAEAMIGAVVAVSNNPLAMVACSPTDPARHRRYAQELLSHLADAGWTLIRDTPAPTPSELAG